MDKNNNNPDDILVEGLEILEDSAVFNVKYVFSEHEKIQQQKLIRENGRWFVDYQF